MSEDVSRIRAALELLRMPRPSSRRKHSWIKNHLETPSGGMCIMGALVNVGAVDRNHVPEAAWGMDNSCADAQAIRKVIREQYPEYHPWVTKGPVGIPDFNDARGRTFEQVEAIMEKAAVLREEEGARSVWTLEARRTTE